MTVHLTARRRRAAKAESEPATGFAEPQTHERASVVSEQGPGLHRPGRRRTLSPLTLRILALNVLPLITLVGGLLYLGEYQRSLLDAKLEALGTQGRIFAGALGETAVRVGAGGSHQLDQTVATHVARRLVAATGARARLFDSAGKLVVDSRSLMVPGGFVQEEELPPLGSDNWLGDRIIDAYDWVVDWLPEPEGLPPYSELADQRASDYPEVMTALAGDAAGAVRRSDQGHVVLSFAVPVQRLKKVAGALMLTVGGSEIENDLRAVRLGILKIFGIVLLITVLLSFYLAGTIARPIRRLAAAAERVRHGPGRRVTIPDFTRRQDEIGDLSGALRQMTDELWQRMEAVESFAADVAHEIKNPLTSLRSAVETAAKVTDAERQRQLMAIILDDVQRLDRLISDISHASRLDAELSRTQPTQIDVGRVLEALGEVQHATAGPGDPRIEVVVPDRPGTLIVSGIEDRLVQVLRNLLSNATSFTPEGGAIRIRGSVDGDFVVVTVSDQGPGIPPANLNSIFDRFYSARPAGEKFGTHSGLGLSISRQIVEAHGGAIYAENLLGHDGQIVGACLVVRLPRMRRGAAGRRRAGRSKQESQQER